MKNIGALIFLFITLQSVIAQITFPVNGVTDERDKTFAFINAHLVVSPELEFTNGILIISKGKVVNSGSNIPIPDNAVVIDLKGKYIYPAFIDLYSDYGISNPEKITSTQNPQIENARKGAYNWNQAVTPEFNAYEYFKTDTSKTKALRANGFGMVLAHNPDGIFRGTGTCVLTGDERENDLIVIDKVSNQYSFKKGSSTQQYPDSQMGAIALIRQTFYDAQWYANGGSSEQLNIALEAINKNKELKQIIETGNKLEILRADKIAREFSFQFIMKGSGDEFQRINEIKNTGAPLIIPVAFPALPDVEDPFDANLISIAQLKSWELAPANPAMLQNAGITFALTQSGLDNKKDFLKNIRKAISYGLSEETALAALTTVPAQIIGVESKCGTLSTDKLANFIITTGPVFKEESSILQTWVNGKMYSVNTWIDEDIRGAYALQIENRMYGLLIQGTFTNPKFSIVKNTDTIKADGKILDNYITLFFKDGDILYRLNGIKTEKNFKGKGQENEKWVEWNADFANVYAEQLKEQKADSIFIGQIMYPFTSYGWYEKPIQEDVLITNATVWTNEKEGILHNYDVLISEGKIIKVGKNISSKNAKVIDGTGKHLTAGIIDEHSHIAISSGVNEGTQSNSAEVRIGDVINCDDINIYRQLSGGVTTSQLLHGSANAIGGQSAIIKLRWGAAPEEMKFAEAPGFIKFALGENVKQSNRGQEYRVRFPQTRMGVEQVFNDAFTRAREYDNSKKVKGNNTRIDLELEAIAEILNGRRFITCHSYVQSEINMLMHVADAHNFKVNTFTHILEGYKVADKMKEHGVGASSFSDWWAYKYEVVEAIPFNAAILNSMGVVTAINSDDAEMGRRLNQEAAKSIKYGNMSEEDALKMVTLNPAKLLHVDKWVGSIKEGKHADMVLWSDNPTSIYAKAEKTFVDGILYFDRETEAARAAELQKERNRIIAKMIAAKNTGESASPVIIILEPEYHCDDVNDYLTEIEN